MQSDEEVKKGIQRIQKNLKETALGINYVPKKYKKRFVELANEEFDSHYGNCLRELIRTYDGFYPTGQEEIEAKLDLLANEIAEIKKDLNPKDNKDPPEGFVYSADRSKLIRKS